MKATDIVTLTEKLDLAESMAPAAINQELQLVHRGILEGVKLATLLKAGQSGNMADVLDSPSAEAWNESNKSDYKNEEREAILIGLFLGSLAMHDVEIEV